MRRSGSITSRRARWGAHDPAAAHRPGRAVEIRFAKGQAAEDTLGFGLELVAAQFGVAGQRVMVFLGFGLPGAGPVSENLLELAMLGR